jgi:hypothetical protein
LPLSRITVLPGVCANRVIAAQAVRQMALKSRRIVRATKMPGSELCSHFPSCNA